MNLLILAFLISLFSTLILIRYKHLHAKLSDDFDLRGPQKFHSGAVPRIGGISIFLSIAITSIISTLFFSQERASLLLQLAGCSLPIFILGFTEDLTKQVGVKVRLLSGTFSAVLAGYFLNVWINHVHVTGVDYVLTIFWISVTFTVIAITGLANAYNIIDGFNGLASMVGILSLLAIGYVGFKVNDPIIASACLIIVGAIGGFFVWNYPRGLIFLGDGGAYLIGFLIAVLSILLVKRNSTVSPWFSLLVNVYPIFETLFTIWRRKFYQGKNPGLPDGVHFHSLIYRRLIRWTAAYDSSNRKTYAANAKTSPFLWLMSTMGIIPSIIWWNNTLALQCFSIAFSFFYLWIYRAVVKFKTPKAINWFK